nr:LysR substrate-binding domain-containing protein [Cupriavidus pinatubonensis]
MSLPYGDGTRAEIDRAFQPERRKLILEVPYAATICSMVGMGLGVSVVNAMVARNLKLQDVKAIPFEPSISFPSYVLHAQQQPEQAIAKAFMDCLSEVVGS